MKTCPVCSAKAFDDARICYGCMHSFEAESHKKEEPSPLDTTTLDWLSPENLKPISAASEDGWISGNDIPPWIESYKDDLDLDEVPLIEETSSCKQVSQESASETAVSKAPVQAADVALCDEGSYEVPLEVYAESWFEDAWDTQSCSYAWQNGYCSEGLVPAKEQSLVTNCSVWGPETRIAQSPSQEVIVRLEFGWIDQAAAAPIRVQTYADQPSRSLSHARAACCA